MPSGDDLYCSKNMMYSRNKANKSMVLICFDVYVSVRVVLRGFAVMQRGVRVAKVIICNPY